jgi:hypothetical protein
MHRTEGYRIDRSQRSASVFRNINRIKFMKGKLKTYLFTLRLFKIYG